MRIAAIGAMVFSVVLCTAMLFWPAGKRRHAVLPPEPVQGVITNVYPKDPSIEVQYGVGKETKLKSFILRQGATRY